MLTTTLVVCTLLAFAYAQDEPTKATAEKLVRHANAKGALRKRLAACKRAGFVQKLTNEESESQLEGSAGETDNESITRLEKKCEAAVTVEKTAVVKQLMEVKEVAEVQATRAKELVKKVAAETKEGKGDIDERTWAAAEACVKAKEGCDVVREAVAERELQLSEALKTRYDTLLKTCQTEKSETAYCRCFQGEFATVKPAAQLDCVLKVNAKLADAARATGAEKEAMMAELEKRDERPSQAASLCARVPVVKQVDCEKCLASADAYAAKLKCVRHFSADASDEARDTPLIADKCRTLSGQQALCCKEPALCDTAIDNAIVKLCVATLQKRDVAAAAAKAVCAECTEDEGKFDCFMKALKTAGAQNAGDDERFCPDRVSAEHCKKCFAAHSRTEIAAFKACITETQTVGDDKFECPAGTADDVCRKCQTRTTELAFKTCIKSASEPTEPTEPTDQYPCPATVDAALCKKCQTHASLVLFKACVSDTPVVGGFECPATIGAETCKRCKEASSTVVEFAQCLTKSVGGDDNTEFECPATAGAETCKRCKEASSTVVEFAQCLTNSVGGNVGGADDFECPATIGAEKCKRCKEASSTAAEFVRCVAGGVVMVADCPAGVDATKCKACREATETVEEFRACLERASVGLIGVVDCPAGVDAAKCKECREKTETREAFRACISNDRKRQEEKQNTQKAELTAKATAKATELRERLTQVSKAVFKEEGEEADTAAKCEICVRQYAKVTADLQRMIPDGDRKRQTNEASNPCGDCKQVILAAQQTKQATEQKEKLEALKETVTEKVTTLQAKCKTVSTKARACAKKVEENVEDNEAKLEGFKAQVAQCKEIAQECKKTCAEENAGDRKRRPAGPTDEEEEEEAEVSPCKVCRQKYLKNRQLLKEKLEKRVVALKKSESVCGKALRFRRTCRKVKRRVRLRLKNVCVSDVEGAVDALQRKLREKCDGKCKALDTAVISAKPDDSAEEKVEFEDDAAAPERKRQPVDGEDATKDATKRCRAVLGEVELGDAEDAMDADGRRRSVAAVLEELFADDDFENVETEMVDVEGDDEIDVDILDEDLEQIFLDESVVARDAVPLDEDILAPVDPIDAPDVTPASTLAVSALALIVAAVAF